MIKFPGGQARLVGSVALNIIDKDTANAEASAITFGTSANVFEIGTSGTADVVFRVSFESSAESGPTINYNTLETSSMLITLSPDTSETMYRTPILDKQTKVIRILQDSGATATVFVNRLIFPPMAL